MSFKLETERLILRILEPTDFEYFHTYRNDPEVARYQAWHMPYSEKAARLFLQSTRKMTPSVHGRWCQIGLVSKEAGHLIGDCGLGRSIDGRQADLGYTLAAKWHGQGLMTEGVSAVLAYYFKELALHRVSATCDIENIRSQRLLERLGFRQEGRYVENFYDEEMQAWRSEYSYAILGSEWGQ